MASHEKRSVSTLTKEASPQYQTSYRDNQGGLHSYQEHSLSMPFAPRVDASTTYQTSITDASTMSWRLQRSNSRRLHTAVGDRDETGVAQALEQGGRLVVNSRDEIGLTSLHRASIKGPPAIIRMLSRAGAHLESTFEGLTSLHMACGRGHEDTVCALLQEGADRDARTAQGFTALHCASGRGGLGSVKVLLRAGADANVQSGGRQKRCPLHAAAVLGDKAVTEELLRWGASVDVPDSEGVTSLHIASAVDNAEVVRCLIGGGASTEVMQAGTLNTPLHLAAFQGSQSALVALLEAGANLSMRNVNGESPLHHACMMMDLAVVETLLRCGADEKARNNDDNTPTQVLGRGLHDQEEGTRGNSHVRAYISTMLARAPIERAWRRRSWLVVMRSRHFYWSHQEGNTGDSYISAVTVSGVPGAVYDREECFGQGDVGVEEESVVGAAFHRLISCVGWIVRVQEEGIFRNVASFL